jgi:thiosulfate/3-mercaptopyruvate sulfurtransferase
MRKLLMAVSAVLAFLTTSLSASAAEIVDAAHVATALKRGAIVWDMRSAEDYAKGHVPGAINIGNAAKVLRNPNTEDFLDVALVAKLMNSAGIDLTKEVIAYANMGDWLPYWGLITIRNFGGKNGKVFHGGMDEWQAAGQPVSTEVTKLAPIDRTLTVDPTVQIYMVEVVSKLNMPDVQIVDVRTPAEYNGDDIRALRGGHIPGARNLPYEQNFVDPATDAKLANGEVKSRDGKALKSFGQLKALYAGLDPSKETIVYCQSGARASVGAAMLRSLGFKNVRVFEESWLGYGNDVSAPAEAVQFFPFNKFASEVKSLGAAVQDLTAEVKALKAAKR